MNEATIGHQTIRAGGQRRASKSAAMVNLSQAPLPCRRSISSTIGSIVHGENLSDGTHGSARSDVGVPRPSTDVDDFQPAGVRTPPGAEHAVAPHPCWSPSRAISASCVPNT